ncbi:unnamed protein product, partial [Polarella glacialis]
ASTLKWASLSGQRSPWHPGHQLDTVDRLVACYSHIRLHQPGARILIFVDGAGQSCLQSCWEAGSAARAALDVAAIHCVPHGCEVSRFLLELGWKKAAQGCSVAAVSNSADVVAGCAAVGRPALQHLGFMFVDDEVVLPGLETARRQPPPPAHRSRSRSRSGQRTAQGAENEDSATLHDSQIDGAMLEEAHLADTLLDEAEVDGDFATAVAEWRRQGSGPVTIERSPGVVTRPALGTQASVSAQSWDELRDSASKLMCPARKAHPFLDEAQEYADTQVMEEVPFCEPLGGVTGDAEGAGRGASGEAENQQVSTVEEGEPAALESQEAGSQASPELAADRNSASLENSGSGRGLEADSGKADAESMAS